MKEFFNFVKDIYYYDMLDNFINDKENYFLISNYVIHNNNFYINDNNGINLATCRKITKSLFKKNITNELKKNNLKIKQINVNDKDIVEFFNITQLV